MKDQQRTSGSTAGYAVKPKCRCGHGETLHDVKGSVRGRCSTYEYGAYCRCRKYEEATDG